jgi:hypothetical protein
MRSRILSKGLTPDDPESTASDRRRDHDPEEDQESTRDAEALVRARIPATLEAIGDHLDRALSSLQRMERKLGELTR